jgi:hypothetical protein
MPFWLPPALSSAPVRHLPSSDTLPSNSDELPPSVHLEARSSLARWASKAVSKEVKATNTLDVAPFAATKVDIPSGTDSAIPSKTTAVKNVYTKKSEAGEQGPFRRGRCNLGNYDTEYGYQPDYHASHHYEPPVYHPGDRNTPNLPSEHFVAYTGFHPNYQIQPAQRYNPGDKNAATVPHESVPHYTQITTPATQITVPRIPPQSTVATVPQKPVDVAKILETTPAATPLPPRQNADGKNR